MLIRERVYRYTNLLESMRKIQKEYKKEAKDTTQDFELNKKDYEGLAKVRKNMLESLDSVVSLQGNLHGYDDRIKRLRERITLSQNDINVYGNKLAILEDKIDTTKAKKLSLITSLQTEGKKIFERNKLEELEEVQTQMFEKFEKLDKEKKDLVPRIHKAEDERSILQAELNTLLHAENNTNEVDMTLKRMKENVINTFKFRGVSTDLEIRANNKLLTLLNEKCATLEDQISSFNDEYKINMTDVEAQEKANYEQLVQAKVVK